MSGNIKGEDMRSDDGAYESSELEAKIQSRLNAVSDEAEPAASEPPKPRSVTSESEADDDDRLPEDAEDDSSGRDDGDPSPKPGAGDEPEAGDDDSGGVAIDEAHYHAAISAGWKPDQISNLLEADPELAKATFEKVYADTNELSRQFAQIGRTRRQLEEQAQGQNQPAAQPRQVNDPLAEKLERLKASTDYDADDPLIGLVEEVVRSRSQSQPQPEQSQPMQHDAEAQMELDFNRVQQVAAFLNADRMNSYEDFYGPAFREDGMPIYDNRGLTPGQAANRYALLEEADAIWLGYAAHGKELSAEEALTKAHLNLTESMRSQKIREELVGKVKKRSKGVRLKPSKSKAPPRTEGSKPKTDAELEAVTARRLAALKGS